MKKTLVLMFFLSIFAEPQLSAKEPAFIDPFSPKYDSTEPNYMEICGSSQYKEKNGSSGGPMGHAVLYLRGACVDHDQALPRLKVCPDQGAGISVNPLFSNARWVGVNGKDFFFKGLLDYDEPVNKKNATEAIHLAISQGIYRNIKLNPKMVQLPEGASVEEYLARTSLATDYALNFARAFYCARIPLKPKMVATVVEALNQMNEDVADGSYQWDMVTDNCAHVVYNAAASVHLWHEKQVNRIFPWEQLYYLAVPVNSVLTGVQTMNDRAITRPIVLYFDNSFREPVADFDYVPVRPRAFLTYYPIHKYENALFDTEARFDVYDYTFLNINQQQLKTVLETPRYWSEEENKDYFRSYYTNLKENFDSFDADLFLVIPSFQLFVEKVKQEIHDLLKTL